MYKIICCPICNSSLIESFITSAAQMHSNKELFNFDQCIDCKFVFLNPRVPLDQLKNYYTSYYIPYRGAKAWGKFKALVEKSQKNLDFKRVRQVLNVYSLSSESLILDIGCGHPSFLKSCQEKLNCQTLGIDFSDEGWKKQSNLYDELDLQVAEIKDLPNNLHPDVITMWHYLEHDYTPFENLSYLKSISKKTTKLVIEVPNFDSASRRKYGDKWAGWHTPRHTSLFSPDNLILLLQKSGWKVSRLQTHGTLDPYLLDWMSKMETKDVKWDKNMEDEFWAFVCGMIIFLPKKLMEKRFSLGIMTVIASPY